MKKQAILLIGVFFLGVGVSQAFFLWQSTKSPSLKPVEITHEATSTSILGQSSSELITVTRVIDGDTIELANGRRVRYIGIDTPETVDPRKPVECYGREAKAENERLVLGKKVRLEKDVSETDRYGRLLRYVYVEDVFVNDYLVRYGFAHAVTYPPDIKLQERFQEAQREARENNRGLWAGCNINPTNTTNQTNTTNVDNKDIQETQSPQSVSSACTIKGNISSSGEKIYHLPGCESYDKTVIDESRGEHWFCTEEEAGNAGWRKAKNC